MNTIEILRQFNRWRRGADIPMPEPIAIGKAIDDAIAEIERLRRGECICVRCGLRQDGEPQKADF